MKRTRRHHRPAFKPEAVALVVKLGYSCAATGRSLGVSAVLIGRWKGKLEEHASEVWRGHGEFRPYAEG